LFCLSTINKYQGSEACRIKNNAFSKYVKLTRTTLCLPVHVSFKRKNKCKNYYKSIFISTRLFCNTCFGSTNYFNAQKSSDLLRGLFCVPVWHFISTYIRCLPLTHILTEIQLHKIVCNARFKRLLNIDYANLIVLTQIFTITYLNYFLNQSI
jgi:RNAse (barnase) inhibitor barstar